MTAIKKQPDILHFETADPSSIDIPRKEVYRYLGYRGLNPSDAISGRIEPLIAEIMKKSRLQAVWLAMPCRLCMDPDTDPGTINSPGLELDNHTKGNTDTGSEKSEESSSRMNPVPQLRIGDLLIESSSLSRNMKGCDTAVMMAATIGPGIDFLIRRSEAVSMLDAAICQAAGAAYVEAWCDEVNARINQFMEEQGRTGRPRFSPGYGDLALSLQKDFSRILDMPKNCGISLTDTLLMTPSKSVTAFIGYAPAAQAVSHKDGTASEENVSAASDTDTPSSEKCSNPAADSANVCDTCSSADTCDYRKQ